MSETNKPVYTDGLNRKFICGERVDCYAVGMWHPASVLQVGYHSGDYLVKIEATGRKMRVEWSHVRPLA